ncbi:hypothetical protein Syun_013882 [Stephania yunnanensis]|uniref:Uncharacterized protein n=1 Tax=Stephania yunnanensis TaxID=152371 RepID=A0AAP0JKI3_9MAGN
MENPLCSNGNISSAPVPYVGLYITGATLVCLLLILYDLFLSFRHKRPYLPCKLFSVNSATLTLLAIVSKLPVDLTTNMPSASDQITKLTGTIMVCVSMAFMMPSMGANRKAESISNMIALSLFVVTIVVNICIQLRTGVIFSFFWEHILISCFMVIMLAVFLHSTNNINAAKIHLAGTIDRHSEGM